MGRVPIALLAVAAVSCSTNTRIVAGAHFSNAEDLLRDGRWEASYDEYAAGCEALGAADLQLKCVAGARGLYGAHAPDSASPPLPQAPGAVAVTTAAQTTSLAVGTDDFLQGAPQPAAYAVIVGVENYAELPSPTGALSDAETFSHVATRTLGVPRDHLKVLLNAQATKASVERAIEWARSTVRGGGRLYFYFSGHGAPDAATGSAYIVPHDGDPKYLAQTALPVSTILSSLGSSPAREVVVFFDSCFSGAGGRSVLPPGARPLVRVREAAPPPNARLAVFAAASDAEISGPSADGKAGLFSKYLVQALGKGQADADGDGQVSLLELSSWVSPRVAREAQDDHRAQHPKLTLGSGVGNGADLILEWGLPSK